MLKGYAEVLNGSEGNYRREVDCLISNLIFYRKRKRSLDIYMIVIL